MSLATGATDTVEIFPLAGGGGEAAVTIDGAEFESAEQSSESGGAIIPTKTNEKGYQWNYRTGPESIDAKVSGRVTNEDKERLKRLRDEKAPFSFASFTTQLPRAHIPSGGLEITTADGYPGAFEVTVSLVEIQQGQTGRATIRAVSESGTKSPKAGSDAAQPGIVSTSGGENGNTGKAGDGDGGGGLLGGLGSFAGDVARGIGSIGRQAGDTIGGLFS